MAQGFIAAQGDRTTPGGGNTIGYSADQIIGQKFTCGGSGAQKVTEIGIYVDTSGGALDHFKLGILPDDAGNPTGPIIGQTSELSYESAVDAWVEETGLNITGITGGVDYWIAGFDNEGDLNIKEVNAAGAGPSFFTGAGTYTYSTWPPGAIVHTDTVWDQPFYAVYEAVVGGRIMSSLINAGGLVGQGGIAGQGGGLAG